jgi:parallel beta-helix repeat protein
VLGILQVIKPHMLTKHTISVVSFLLTSFVSFGANVSGVVKLEGATDHSGISITFIPKTLSAQEASAISLADGSYTASVVGGLYDVRFAIDGHPDRLLVGQLISGDAMLTQVTISSTIPVHVSGDVSGTWTHENTYVVDGNITVPSGSELIIEAGSNIEFTGFYSFKVMGKLTANGTSQKPILFTSNSVNKSRGMWIGIEVNTVGDTTRFTHCQIEYAGSKEPYIANLSIKSTGALVVRNCVVRGSTYACITNEGSGYLEVRDTEMFNAYYYGVKTEPQAKSTLVYNCHIHHIDFYGVLLYGLDSSVSRQELVGSSVHDCNYMAVSVSGNGLVEGNILYNAPYGVFVTGWNPTIKNNTIRKNGHGIGIYDNLWNPQGVVNSNIIVDNTGYAIYSQGNFSPSVVQYNLINGNGSGIANRPISGLATIVTINAQGFSADTYFNIFEAPDFYSTNANDANFLRLASTSAAIDSGDPNYKDNDNSIVDCGAFKFDKYFQQITFDSLEEKVFGDDDFDLEATASSSLPVTFASDNNKVAIVTGAKVTIVGAGTAQITASQSGNTVYLPAADVVRMLVVSKAGQSITFDSIPDRTLGDEPFFLTATASSGLPVSYLSDPDQISFDSANATLVSPGRVIVTAMQAGNTNFDSASNVIRSFCIHPAKPEVTLDDTGKMLISSSDLGNQWYFEGNLLEGATAKTQLLEKVGTYTVIATVDDCSSEVADEFVITGINGESALKPIQCFPNPFEEKLTVEVSGIGQTELQFKLVNSMGATVFHDHFQNHGVKSIDMHNSPAGIYLLQVIDGDRIYVERVVKK